LPDHSRSAARFSSSTSSESLYPSGAEQLDAVVIVGVMGGRDHDTKVRPRIETRQHGGRPGVGIGPEQKTRSIPDRGKACHQPVLDHIAGQPRVLCRSPPDGDDRHDETQRPASLTDPAAPKSAVMMAVGRRPANSIGAKILSRHCFGSSAVPGRRCSPAIERLSRTFRG